MREKKKNVLEMIKHTLLMMIFMLILIGGTMLWESRTVEREEHAVLNIQEAQKIKWAQISQYKSEGIVFDGEDIEIGERK